MKSKPTLRNFILATFCASSLSLHAATIDLDLTSTNSGAISLASGSNTFTFSGFSVDYLIVAGGGGGGGGTTSASTTSGGGGGAGGLLQGATQIGGAQSIVVGAGGAGGNGGTTSHKVPSPLARTSQAAHRGQYCEAVLGKIPLKFSIPACAGACVPVGSCMTLVGLNSIPNRRCRNIARSTSTNSF